jgi:xylulokinase
MMLIGYDLGSSSIKASLLNADTGTVVASATYPKQEMKMISKKRGWAEQDPEIWWSNIKNATTEMMAATGIKKEDIKAIGISYQMHGLVLVDKDKKSLRPSIIWCDSRAVEIGRKAFHDIGDDYCLSNLLNSPGNFTASKLKWVKDNEPELYEKIHKIMLPGDYIAMRLTGEVNTTASGMSEGILWNFKQKNVDSKLLEYYGFSPSLLPDRVDTFSHQGSLTAEAATALGLKEGTPVTYRAGDQPNNAFSLNVLNPGEVAATAGTSGVVYGIIDKPAYDRLSRVNTFVHVNYSDKQERYGVLLCVNGTGILNSWLRQNIGDGTLDYNEMNELASQAPIGADGLSFLPFGNGAERIMENRNIGAQLHGLNFNRHDQRHLLRAGQEGIVFALNYGFNIMKEMGLEIRTIRAGYANMFLSPIFREAFCNLTGAIVELYNTDGAAGAARGAGVGAGIYANFDEAFQGLKSLDMLTPNPTLLGAYDDAYGNWLNALEK